MSSCTEEKMTVDDEELKLTRQKNKKCLVCLENLDLKAETTSETTGKVEDFCNVDQLNLTATTLTSEIPCSTKNCDNNNLKLLLKVFQLSPKYLGRILEQPTLYTDAPTPKQPILPFVGFCSKCQDSLLHIEGLLAQITCLQGQVLRMKAKIKSRICKSRLAFQEKRTTGTSPGHCIDKSLSTIRDLITGVFVELVRYEVEKENKVTVKNSRLLEDREDGLILADIFETPAGEALESEKDEPSHSLSLRRPPGIGQQPQRPEPPPNSSPVPPELQRPCQGMKELAKEPQLQKEKLPSKSKKDEKPIKTVTMPDGRIFYRGIEILLENNKFRCSKCKDKDTGLFIYRHSCIRHIRKLHIVDTEKWFQCETCGKHFFIKSLLAAHQETHHSQLMHMCDVCGRQFKLEATLRGHRKTHDKDRPKPYSCEFCGYQFAHLKDCIIHTRRHTKERPFKCQLCPKAFIVRCELNKHLKNRHPDYIPAPEVLLGNVENPIQNPTNAVNQSYESQSNSSSNDQTQQYPFGADSEMSESEPESEPEVKPDLNLKLNAITVTAWVKPS